MWFLHLKTAGRRVGKCLGGLRNFPFLIDRVRALFQPTIYNDTSKCHILYYTTASVYYFLGKIEDSLRIYNRRILLHVYFPQLHKGHWGINFVKAINCMLPPTTIIQESKHV